MNLGNFKKIPETLGNKGHCLGGQPKGTFLQKHLKIAKKKKKKNSCKIFYRKTYVPMLLNFVNLPTKFCSRLQCQKIFLIGKRVIVLCPHPILRIY